MDDLWAGTDHELDPLAEAEGFLEQEVDGHLDDALGAHGGDADLDLEPVLDDLQLEEGVSPGVERSVAHF